MDFCFFDYLFKFILQLTLKNEISIRLLPDRGNDV